MRKITLIFVLLTSQIAWAASSIDKTYWNETHQNFHRLNRIFKSIDKECQKGEKVTVVIVPRVKTFPNREEQNYCHMADNDAYILTEDLINAFAGRITVVDRARLDYILKEKHLSLTGLMEKDISDMGLLLNANYFIFVDMNADLTRETKSLVSITLIKTSTNEILSTYVQYVD